MKTAVTLLVFCVTSLLALGMVTLYSSVVAGEGVHWFWKQLVWCSAGCVASVLVARMDYRWLKKHAMWLLGAALAMLVYVLVFEKERNGAQRWINLHIFLFQPSEFAKVALIVAIAWYGERNQRFMHTWVRGLIIPGGMIAILLGLIFVEPDRGTTVLLAGVSCAMLLISGVRWRAVVPPIVLGVVGLAFSIFHDPVRSRRVVAWMNPEETRMGAGYQAYQAMLALGNGGWTGVGLGNGRQKLGFVPEHHTDFIFSVIGEELGLIASVLVIVCFVLLVLCGLYIALNAPDRFGQLLGCGISLLIGMQAFINIGVVTSALPNKGLPLPFISYGGSNLLMMLMAVGLLLSIARLSPVPDNLGMKSRRSGDVPVAQIS